MHIPLTVLLVEDDEDDALLLVDELRRAGFVPTWTRVQTEAAFLARLDEPLDLILSDYQMPQFDGLRAFSLLTSRKLELPFILISGKVGEDAAVAAMKLGITDYLLKDRLGRLGPAVSQALAQNRARRERAASEHALRLFRTLVDQCNDTLEVVDPATGRFIDVNDHGLLAHGLTRAEYLDKCVWDLDIHATPESWPERAALIRAQGSFEIESSHRRKDGSVFPIELTAKWVTLDRDYIVVVLRDISVRRASENALRTSEERFRQLAENIHEVFWITGPSGKDLHYVSPAYETIWGRTRESLTHSTCRWRDTLHPDDADRIVFAAISRQHLGGYSEEYRILRPDGTVRWIRDRAFPVHHPDGSLQRIVGVAEDITESRRLQEQFLRSQRLEAIGTLAGGIAHDLNNILAPLVLAPALIRESLTREQDRSLLDLIEASARRGSNVVRQLLTFSRGTGGERVSVNTAQLLHEMHDVMRETFPRHLTLGLLISDDVSPSLGDPTQLHQVLMNLCVNARDAMPAGGRLTLTARNALLTEAEVAAHAPARPGPHVAISVIDTGTGIPPEVIGRIFDPFFTTKPPHEGTGLGLSTVLGIVRSHRGLVTVTSAPGQGSTFTIHVPVAWQPAPAPAEPAPATATRCRVGRGELILVVDDEAPIRTATQLILQHGGYSVLTASEGTEALDLFLKNRAAVRLVLTDVMMPGMGGLDLIRALHRVSPGIKVLATSGLNDHAGHTDLQAAGFERVLNKPYGARELLDAIHAALPTPAA